MAQLVARAMGNLAPKLLQLLQDEYKLQKGLRVEVKSLAQELESTHIALCKVPPDKLDPQVKLWARDVREASYDMEDILDTFLVRVDGGDHQPANEEKAGKFERLQEKMGKLFSLSKLKARHDIARAIEDIKKQVDEMTKRRERYKVNDLTVNPSAPTSIDPRLSALYTKVSELIGINGAVGELISMLSLQKDEVSCGKLKIVSVFGIGGLGKTTLAKDILIDLDKRKYTDVGILVWDEKQLIEELRDFLRSKRYLIVVDDVWEAKSWKIITLALDENNRGSRIIITTRNSEVTSGEVYKLKPLSDENSKSLLYRRIFGGEDQCPDNQVDEVLDKILKKCGGIPLAIITMASLSVGKSRGEWFEVCNSIGFCDKDIEQVDRTMRILSLSYYDLPCHLRACLLYLSAFPEDYTINKNTLIWMWIAEDFVDKKPHIELFEVGEGYFNDLVNRSMIQAVESESKGIIDGCRVHDMVLDLLHSLSREENFVTILLDNDEGTSISSARRLSHQKSTLDAHLDNHNKGVPKMRSFIAYRCYNDKEVSFQSFKLLRVLDLKGVYMKSSHNAKHLGNLLHLRYLGLKLTNRFQLPKEIGSLKFLQTLDLESYDLQELPSSVGQLTQLVCLLARDNCCFSRLPSCSNPSCLINLSHLELNIVSMDEKSMQILTGLPELRHLELETESTVTVANIATDGFFQKLRVCRFYSSMVLFVLNKGSSVSFTLFDGTDGIKFGSRKKKEECRRAPAIMPNLQELLFKVDQFCIEHEVDYGNLGLEYLTSLKKVTVPIDSTFCKSKVVEAAEAELRHAIDVHPNHPTLILKRFERVPEVWKVSTTSAPRRRRQLLL
ncbi:unnamed protein product [Urochloa decumbens]|uniref:Uncharacterized protein n=1 Tax=Urochloa decumbens TaxID=240449 RepID=A0ABC9F102_9POAL